MGLSEVLSWLDPELHVVEMCFKLETSSWGCPLWLLAVDEAPLEEAPAVAPDSALAPLICTSCPTWSLSLEVSPVNW